MCETDTNPAYFLLVGSALLKGIKSSKTLISVSSASKRSGMLTGSSSTGKKGPFLYSQFSGENDT